MHQTTITTPKCLRGISSWFLSTCLSTTSMNILKLWILRSLAKPVWPVSAFLLFFRGNEVIYSVSMRVVEKCPKEFTQGKSFLMPERRAGEKRKRGWRKSFLRWATIIIMLESSRVTLDDVDCRGKPVMDKAQHCIVVESVMTWYDNCLHVKSKHSGSRIHGNRANNLSVRCLCEQQFFETHHEKLCLQLNASLVDVSTVPSANDIKWHYM